MEEAVMRGALIGCTLLVIAALLYTRGRGINDGDLQMWNFVAFTSGLAFLFFSSSPWKRFVRWLRTTVRDDTEGADANQPEEDEHWHQIVHPDSIKPE
jgi:hypothetical protein